MKCEAINEDLQAFLDDELGPEDRERVADHVAACPACRATLRDLRAVSGVLGKWAVPEPEGLPSARDLLARAQVAAITPTATHAWPPVGFQRWLAAAALVVIAAGFSLVVFRASQNIESTESARRSEVVAPVREPAHAEAPTGPTTSGGNQSSESTGAARPAVGPSAPPTAESADDAETKKEKTDAAEPEEQVQVTGANRVADAPAGNEAAPPPAPAAMAPAAPEEGASGAGASQPEDAPKPMIDEAAAETAEARPAPKRAQSRDLAVTGRRFAGGEVVKRASLRLGVDDPGSAADRVASIAAASGGAVASRSASRSDGRDDAIRLTLRVDPDRFESAVSRIRALGTVRGESSSSKDVSGRIRELDEEIAEGRADAADERARGRAPGRAAQKAAPASSARRERDNLINQALQATIEVVIENE